MKVLWFVSSLEQKGGGERFVLEGAQAIRALGHDVRIVCDRLAQDASFDGRYDLSAVICTGQNFSSHVGYVRGVVSKLGGFSALYRVAREQSPELIICQSEYDAIKVYGLSKLLRFRYRVFVFGQMFQFKTDISRYASIFSSHLQVIVASRPGYRDTVALPPPKFPLHIVVLNELVSRLKYNALRAADQVFVLSNQVKWEVSLLYGRDSQICCAAFDAEYINCSRISSPRLLGKPIRFVSVCRLVDKKRVDLTIAAFSSSRVDGVLTIIGTGSEDARLKALARSGARANDITFLGAVDDARLLTELEAADCFVSMDIGDYDLSVVEAMGKGLRVLVAADFDLSTFGQEVAGVVVVRPEINELVSAMENLEHMPPPSAQNIPALQQLTWQSLARKCAEL